MALDGLLLRQVVKEIQPSLPLKIQRIYNLSENELLFQVRSQKLKQQLLISCHSVHNRIQWTQRDFVTPQEPTQFVMLLRKHLEDAVLYSFEQIGLDRIVKAEIQQRDALGDLHIHTLYIELMGKYANLILVNHEGRIQDALKRIPPFENTQRTLQPGAQYELPHAAVKANPFTTQSVSTHESLTNTLDGVSPILAKELEYRLNHQEDFTKIMRLIDQSKELYLHTKGHEVLAHCIPLTHLELPYQVYPVMEGYDRLYQDQEEKERIKQHTGDLIKFVSREAKRQSQKLPKLLDALDEALDCEKWKVYGDYLYAYATHLPSGQSECVVEDFETSKPLSIPLDVRYDGKQNAGRYYQKYHKGRKGQVHIRSQIEKTQAEIDYFVGLQEQLAMASVIEALQIREELASLGYVPLRKGKKHKDQKIYYTQLSLDNGVQVYFGKNNQQNELVSFKLSRKNDTWLHAKDYHGAHVIIAQSNPDEATLRMGAQLAAYFSQARLGSSVPIDYCEVKDIKKIPGSKPGLVALGSHKTIYIDPDQDFVLNLIQKTQVHFTK